MVPNWACGPNPRVVRLAQTDSTAEGRKLPPYIVFEREAPLEGMFPPGIVVRVQEKGRMSDELVDWMKTAWAKRPGGLLRRRALLVLDSFQGHVTDRVKDRLAAT